MGLSTNQINKAIAATNLMVKKIDDGHYALITTTGDVARDLHLKSLNALTRAEWIEAAEDTQAVLPAELSAFEGLEDKGQKCRVLRAAARNYREQGKTRKEFIADAVARGATKGVASDMWHFSKYRAD